jgi:uncharacterized protein DUF6498
MRKKWDAGRLQTLLRISVANAVVVFSTFYSDWTLRVVTLAYAGELIILMLVVQARVLAAKRMPGSRGADDGRRLRRGKFNALMIALLIYPLFAGVTAVVVFGDVHDWYVPRSILLSLCLAWLTFLVSHTLDFIATLRIGAYDELIGDRRVMAPLWRWPVMIFAFLGAAFERDTGEEFMPWYFILILAAMAYVNIRLQVAEMDAIRATVRRKQ